MAPERGACCLHLPQDRGDTPLDIDACALDRASNPAFTPTQADGSFHLGFEELEFSLCAREPTGVIPGLSFGDFSLKLAQSDAVGVDRLAV